MRRPRYSPDEFAQRGDEIYARSVRPIVEPAHIGAFVAVDIESGDWELDVDPATACRKLIAKLPDCQSWLVRVGSRHLYRIG